MCSKRFIHIIIFISSYRHLWCTQLWPSKVVFTQHSIWKLKMSLLAFVLLAGAKCIGSWQTSRSHGASGGHQLSRKKCFLCSQKRAIFCWVFGCKKQFVDWFWYGKCYEIAAGKYFLFCSLNESFWSSRGRVYIGKREREGHDMAWHWKVHCKAVADMFWDLYWKHARLLEVTIETLEMFGMCLSDSKEYVSLQRAMLNVFAMFIEVYLVLAFHCG